MKPLVIALLLCAGLSSCTTSARFMNFGWESERAEIADTLRANGFTFNDVKGRWQGGRLFGFECEKVKVWYDSLGYLTTAEARYEEIDSITSEKIYTALLTKTERDFGAPDITFDEKGSVRMNRRTWMLGKDKDDLIEMIVLTRFDDVVIFNASRTAPEPFDRVASRIGKLSLSS